MSLGIGGLKGTGIILKETHNRAQVDIARGCNAKMLLRSRTFWDSPMNEHCPNATV